MLLKKKKLRAIAVFMLCYVTDSENIALSENANNSTGIRRRDRRTGDNHLFNAHLWCIVRLLSTVLSSFLRTK